MALLDPREIAPDNLQGCSIEVTRYPFLTLGKLLLITFKAAALKSLDGLA
jgi:hypothetical protein